MAEFTFRTNSKLKTLAQELITNNNIAIFELIKLYDAGATGGRYPISWFFIRE